MRPILAIVRNKRVRGGEEKTAIQSARDQTEAQRREGPKPQSYPKRARPTSDLNRARNSIVETWPEYDVSVPIASLAVLSKSNEPASSVSGRRGVCQGRAACWHDKMALELLRLEECKFC